VFKITCNFFASINYPLNESKNNNLSTILAYKKMKSRKPKRD